MADKKVAYKYNFGKSDEFRPLKGPTLRDTEDADFMYSDMPDRKAMRAVTMSKDGDETETDAGAGRGKVNPPTVKKAKGGYVKAADGCAQRGKTKGRMV